MHGNKRADWANAGREVAEVPQLRHPPLLHAARLGSLESVEWFLSDAATRCYSEFAENNRSDKRIQNLAKAQGGLEASISAWLNLRSKLIMHCVVLGKTTEGSLNLLRYLCKKAPELLQHKSANGLTPLHLAFSLHRTKMIQVLLEAGADQTCRNKAGDNIVHSILNNTALEAKKRPEKIREMLSLIDTRLLSSLFAERTSADPGASTPLARWLHSYFYGGRYSNADSTAAVEILEVILEFSKGEDLAIINGEGDTPLHAAVRYKADGVLNTMLECRPELLFRENATGRTSLEMAEDAYLSTEIFNDPPILPGADRRWNQRGDNRYFWRDTTRPLEKGPKSFVTERVVELSDNEKIWDTCQKFAQKAGPTKRKLVSLIEAGEVARRLASRKRKTDNDAASSSEESDDGDDMVDEEEKIRGDEVAVWFQMALTISQVEYRVSFGVSGPSAVV